MLEDLQLILSSYLQKGELSRQEMCIVSLYSASVVQLMLQSSMS